MSLRPCTSCGRHVRVSETSCPFCATALRSVAEVPEPVVAPRSGRAAILLFGAAVSTATMGGCVMAYGSPGDVDANVQAADSGGPGPLYGGPPDTGVAVDSGVTADSGAAADDSGGPGPLYGGPALDAAAEAQDAGMVAMYGGPPTDGGNNADAFGGVAPLYGGSPGA